MRIDALTLRSFRGATTETTIEFDRSKKISLIYGENGTGKSTIVDGIDCLCNESCGSLEERSLDGGHKRKHLPSIGMRDADVTVEVKSGGQTWTSSLTSNGPRTSGPSKRPQVHVLRRARLTKLVEATAQQKYEELASFVNVTQVEASEAELLKAVKAAQNGFNESSRAVEVANRTLENTWIDLGKPGEPHLDHVGWAEQEALRDSSEELRQAEIARALLTQIEATTSAASRLKESRTNVQHLQEQKSSLLSSSGGDQVFSLSQQRDLVQVLQQAQRFLSGASGDGTCPVCETPQSLSELRHRLGERVFEINASNEQLGMLERCEADLKKAEPVYESAKKEATLAATQLAQLWGTAQEQLPNLPQVPELDVFRNPHIDVTTAEPLIAHVTNQVNSATPLLVDITEKASRDDKHLASIRNNLKTLKEEREKAQDWESKHTLLDQIHGQVRSLRLDFAQGILDEVHADCDAIYQAMHPGEDIGPEALILDPDRRGSVKQPCRFGEHKGVPPAAYFSESHTDTLALALFVAIVKRQGGKDSILVLDDVFTSVDTPHLLRVLNMIVDQSKHFAQVIITTHFRRMYEEYRSQRVGAGLVDGKELDLWGLNRGIAVVGSQLILDELRAVVARRPLSRNDIASSAGYLLDTTFNFLTLNYECSVPRKPRDEFSLSDWTNNFRKVAQKMKVQRGEIKDGTWNPIHEIEIGPLFDPLESANVVRNSVGAHYKLIGNEYGDREIIDFGEATVRFMEGVSCPNCMSLPKKPMDTYWTCECGACRTTPRRKPS